MSWRRELALLACAAVIVASGGLLGAVIVTIHHVDGPPLISDGALGMSEERPIAP